MAIEQDGKDVLIRIKAVPGSSRNTVAGVLGGRLKVRVSAPPEDGRANEAICRLFAETLGLRRKHVSIETGHASKDKTIRIAGADAASVRHRLVGD